MKADHIDQDSGQEELENELENMDEHAERITIEDYNREIDEAMKRVQEGKYTSLEDLQKKLQS